MLKGPLALASPLCFVFRHVFLMACLVRPRSISPSLAPLARPPRVPSPSVSLARPSSSDRQALLMVLDIISSSPPHVMRCWQHVRSLLATSIGLWHSAKDPKLEPKHSPQLLFTRCAILSLPPPLSPSPSLPLSLSRSLLPPPRPTFPLFLRDANYSRDQTGDGRYAPDMHLTYR